jgi:phosphate transport system substrate-binding protein
MRFPLSYFLLAALALAVFACGDGGKDKKPAKELDGPTYGTIKLMVDEGYKPVISSCIDVFDSLYDRAKLLPTYTGEAECVNALMRDSVEVIIISRKLVDAELAYFKGRGFTPPMTPIAHDALAFVFNLVNTDTVLTKDQVQQVLSGKISAWKDLNPASKLGNIQVVFDHPGSGTLRYVKDSILLGQPLVASASAVKTNEEVIEYVKKNKNAFGIISANWVSDTDDKGTQKFMREIRIAEVAKATGESGYGPYQAYMANGKYPYIRTVYIINAQARRGLGLGFATYLAQPGQRIFLKDGLLPANVVPRLIQVNK